MLHCQNVDLHIILGRSVVAKAKLNNDPRDHQIRNHQRLMQTHLAQELHQNAGVPLGPCELEQAKQFQGYLTDYPFSIVSKEYGNKIIYAGPEKDKKIDFYMHNHHYDVFTKMPAFFCPQLLLPHLQQTHDHQEDHRCPSACKCCQFASNCPEVSWMTCNDCC